METEQIFVGVGVIVEKDNKFLVVEEKSADLSTDKVEGAYSFPGGHLLSGESLESACEREVYEETKVKIKAEYIIGFFLVKGALGIGVKAEYLGEDLFKETEEIKKIRWMSAEEINNNKEKFRPGQLIGYMTYLKGGKFELSTVTTFL